MAKKSAKKSAKKAAKKSARKTTGRKSAAKSTRKAAKKSARKSGRRPNPAFMKPLTPSPALAEVVGSKPLPRTEVTSRLWAYIKKNGLQDTTNRRNVNADAKLKPVFGGKSTVSMFEMTKLVSKHLK